MSAVHPLIYVREVFSFLCRERNTVDTTFYPKGEVSMWKIHPKDSPDGEYYKGKSPFGGLRLMRVRLLAT